MARRCSELRDSLAVSTRLFVRAMARLRRGMRMWSTRRNAGRITCKLTREWVRQGCPMQNGYWQDPGGWSRRGGPIAAPCRVRMDKING